MSQKMVFFKKNLILVIRCSLTAINVLQRVKVMSFVDVLQITVTSISGPLLLLLLSLPKRITFNNLKVKKKSILCYKNAEIIAKTLFQNYTNCNRR